MAEGQRAKRREAAGVRGTQGLQDPAGCCIYPSFSGKVLRGSKRGRGRGEGDNGKHRPRFAF